MVEYWKRVKRDEITAIFKVENEESGPKGYICKHDQWFEYPPILSKTGKNSSYEPITEEAALHIPVGYKSTEMPFEPYKELVLAELSEFGNFKNPDQEARAYLQSDEVKENLEWHYEVDYPAESCAWSIDMLY